MAPPTLARTGHWRWFCCLLALVLPLQSAWISVLRTQGPAHGHQLSRASAQPRPAAAAVPVVTPQQVRAALRHGHGSRQARAPAFEGWAVVTATGGWHAHAHGERHHHAPGDTSVVHSDRAAEAQAETVASRDGLVWAPPRHAVAAGGAARVAAPSAVAFVFASHMVPLPDKPPRA